VAPSLPRPARPPRVDVALAAAFLAASLVQIAVAPIAHPAVSVLIAVGFAVPVVVRRVVPVGAALALTAAWSIPTTDGFLLLGYAVSILVFYALGAYVADLRWVAAVSVVAAAVGVAMTLLGPEPEPAAIGAVLVVCGPVLAGRLVAHQHAQNARLQELTEELVHERAAAERAAAAEERTRIARELHDVIGHEVTVIALQADAAAAALARAPERARVPVETIRAAAAETLAEMRRVVGLLRGPADDDDEDLRPQPGLADLPALVERARAAGAEVQLDLRLPPQPPAQSLQVAIYRVVQEALTNARRHAPGSTVRVHVGHEADVLCVEVVNRGGRRAAASGGGHGVVGMRERVRMHGGRFTAEPTDDGFAVTARLPLGAMS
jgi:signal transduction histidine kinase